MDFKISLNRAKIRDKENTNRYENFDEAFHKKIRKYFKSLPKIDKRYILVDATKSIEEINLKILKFITKLISQ